MDKVYCIDCEHYLKGNTKQRWISKQTRYADHIDVFFKHSGMDILEKEFKDYSFCLENIGIKEQLIKTHRGHLRRNLTILIDNPERKNKDNNCPYFSPGKKLQVIRMWDKVTKFFEEFVA